MGSPRLPALLLIERAELTALASRQRAAPCALIEGLSGVAGRGRMVLTGYPHDSGQQAQRVGAAAIFQAARLHLLGQYLGVAGDGFRGAQQGFSCENQL
jgi:hypothetical protein